MQQSQTATIAVRQSEKPKKEKDEFIIEFGKFFLDLAKLTFAGVFLTAIMDISIDMVELLKWCSGAIFILSTLGFVLMKVGFKK